MADKFRVGQRVRYVNVAGYQEKYNGKIVTIIEPRMIRNTANLFGYRVDHLSPYGTGYLVLEENIEPLYDGDEASSWSECAWKPEEMKT